MSRKPGPQGQVASQPPSHHPGTSEPCPQASLRPTSMLDGKGRGPGRWDAILSFSPAPTLGSSRPRAHAQRGHVERPPPGKPALSDAEALF